MISLNGMPQPFVGYQDTVLVPPADSNPMVGYGEVQVIIPFTNPLITGKFVFHCHILTHEDRGMMAIVEVVATAQPPAGGGVQQSSGMAWSGALVAVIVVSAVLIALSLIAALITIWVVFGHKREDAYRLTL